MKSTLKTLAGLAGAVVCIAIAMRLASMADGLTFLDAWVTGYGVAGMAVFAIVGGLAVVFFFPGSILMTASGAAFGLGWGFATALVAACLGAALAFLVSRHVARERIERWAARKPRFAAVDQAIGEEGWKLVVLTRCCPIFPYIFQNYAYGLTRVRFRHYALGSFIGLVPATLLFVYMGSLGRTGAQAVAGHASSLEMGLRGLGFVASILVTIYITRISTRALGRAGL